MGRLFRLCFQRDRPASLGRSVDAFWSFVSVGQRARVLPDELSQLLRAPNRGMPESVAEAKSDTERTTILEGLLAESIGHPRYLWQTPLIRSMRV